MIDARIEQIYRDNYAMMHKLTRKLPLDAAEREQLCYIAIWETLFILNGENYKNLLQTITMRKVDDELKFYYREKNQAHRMMARLDEPNTKNGGEEMAYPKYQLPYFDGDAEERRMWQIVRELVADMPEMERKVMLVAIMGSPMGGWSKRRQVSIDHITRVTGYNKKQVDNALQRLRGKIKKYMEVSA